MRSKRIDDIKDYIYRNKTVTLDKICEIFEISKSTIRRDLQEILSDSNLKKIYGGITLQSKKELISFTERNIENMESKINIAHKAASLVNENDVIFIDSGTTTFHMIDSLINIKNLTIITNNIEVIYRAINHENINIISLSGTLNRKTLSFTGTSSAAILKNFNISKSFMATTGFSIYNGVTNSYTLESDIKRTAVERSNQVILLADRSKFNVVSLVTYCDLKKIDILVTNNNPPKDIYEYLKNNNIQIIISN